MWFLGKLLKLSLPQVPHLETEDSYITVDVRTESDNAYKMFTQHLVDSEDWVSGMVAGVVLVVAIFRRDVYKKIQIELWT